MILDSVSAETQQRLPVEIDTTKTKIQNLTSVIGSDVFPYCLSVNQNYNAILIDTVGQVRGIYQELDRDETDRLIMEVKILTGNY